MIYPNALIPLVAEPIHRGRNGRDSHRDHFCCAKAGVSQRKSVMPLRLLSNHQGLSVLLIPNKFAIFVGNKSFQTVPKQKGAMNTQSRRHDIYSSQAHQYSASVPGRVYAMPRKSVSINCLMRALVPLGEKSSESVPERVLPYRY